MSLKREITNLAKNAREASRSLLSLTSGIKNKVMRDMSRALIKEKEFILKENYQDLKKARALRLSPAFIERLALNDKRIKEMADSLAAIAKLPDPVGEVIKAWRRPNGLLIHKVRVPIGVIAIIYESRPNVTSDCIGLGFKSGNSVILRGGSEALNSSLAIYNTLKKVIKKYKVAQGAVNMIKTSDRRAVDILLKLNNYIDLVMPRGGEGLIKKITQGSFIPVIKHYQGICHVYVDEWADLNMAEDICFNAKVQRPGVCNAMESMLVHQGVASRFLPGMIKKFKQVGVELRGCAFTQKIVKRSHPELMRNGGFRKATEKDYRTEYLDLILSVKVLDNLQAAVRHINEYGSHHSDAIVTDNQENAAEFLKLVDSACVYLNASTRFTDGYQFGLGAEIGISTDKLHARGPVALEELTTYKYRVVGNGQIRTS